MQLLCHLVRLFLVVLGDGPSLSTVNLYLHLVFLWLMIL